MDVYISLEAAIEKAVEYCTDDDGSCSKGHTDLRELLDDLENLPTADVKPVVRGKWIEFDEDSLECSNCGQLWTLNDGTPKENNMNYCPNCGAKMEGTDATNCVNCETVYEFLDRVKPLWEKRLNYPK